MENRKKRLYVFMMIAAPGAGLALMVVEGCARIAGLELRTFAQMGKGLYLWLAMPYIILFAGNSLLMNGIRDRAKADENKRILSGIAVWSDRIIVGIFCLVILGAALFRGMFYVFSREMVMEKILPDGYIEGTWSDFLSESHKEYYLLVAGIFRRPFPGWNEMQMTEEVQERYHREAELVKRQENGLYLFRAPDVLEPGAFISFRVSNSYHVESDYFFQVLCAEAAHFWDNRDRSAMICGNGKERMTFAEAAERSRSGDDIAVSGRLCIACDGSQEDIAACAADLTDWLQYVKEAGQFPWDSQPVSSYLVSKMGMEKDGDVFYLQLFPLEDYIGGDPWETRCGRMREKLEDAFSGHLMQVEGLRELTEDAAGSTDVWDGTDNTGEDASYDFMDFYDGSYEKECLVGDGMIRYRMVVEDAALGSRFYGLLKSTDGGKTWKMSNPDPFDQQMGMGIDFIFLDEEFGFATLMHNGGDEADLYVTEDGGGSYQAVEVEAYMVTLENGDVYAPYDYPQMPYEEDGVLCLLCGQGADGDYAGGDAAGLAFYQSADGGHSFQFVEIRKP